VVTTKASSLITLIFENMTDYPEQLAAPLCCGLSSEQINAINQASDILHTEANELARYLEGPLKVKLTLRLQEITDTGPVVPHRVAIAVRNEMNRLREVAEMLLAMRPLSPKTDDDE